MSQGRGSAGQFMAISVIMCLLILNFVAIQGAVYTVGDSGGWTLNLSRWPRGKSFKAGDVLVFNYDSTIHNVVAVDKGGYNNCATPAGAKVFATGKDMIKLSTGMNYFICKSAGHCESGMKIAVKAA